jgi:hypothetical protein
MEGMDAYQKPIQGLSKHVVPVSRTIFKTSRDLSSNDNIFWPTGRNSSESTPDILLSETGASIFGSSDCFGAKRCKM